MKNIGSYIKFAALGGIIYLLGRYVIFQAEGDYSSMPDWLFRLVLIVFISMAIISQKKKNKGILSFKDAFVSGGITTTLLAIFISISTWFYCDVVNQDYTKGYQAKSRTIYYDKMMRAHIYETYGKEVPITQEHKDYINEGLDKYMEKTAYFYTTPGQIYANLLHTVAWGVAIILTVAMLNRNVKED